MDSKKYRHAKNEFFGVFAPKKSSWLPFWQPQVSARVGHAAARPVAWRMGSLRFAHPTQPSATFAATFQFQTLAGQSVVSAASPAEFTQDRMRCQR
jgi:hypothetical protein